METIKPQENQSIFDIALQKYGSIEGVFDLLNDNDIDRVDNQLSVYNELEITSPPTRREIKEFYTSRSILPATDATLADLALLEDEDDCIGIGCMEVGEDFVVCPPEDDIPSEQLRIDGFAVGNFANPIFFKDIENAIYYRESGSSELGNKVLLSKEIDEGADIAGLKILMSVLPKKRYEIYIPKTIEVSTSILITVSIPADNMVDTNIFNSTEVLNSISKGERFLIKFSNRIIQL